MPALYTPQADVAPLTVTGNVIRFNNSLGDQTTIEAFGRAMADFPAKAEVVLELTDTPSGGSTSVARAIMGWFVDPPRSYQIHERPSEERETGVARQWIEQVLPLRGKYHSVLPLVRVGHWTGSMGEGLAIGFAELGARVEGTAMAQLRGAIYDFSHPSSGLTVKFPAERLYTVQGQPRENFVPLAAPGTAN